MGAAKMRLGQKRRVITRIVLAVAVATVTAAAVWGGTVVSLVDITWI
jgi:hypothetical protein